MSRHRRNKPSEAIARRIKQIRHDLAAFGKDMPQRELAKLAGVNERTVKRWEENGILTIDSATALAAAVGCSVEWIFEGRGSPPRRGVGEPGLPQDARSPRRPTLNHTVADRRLAGLSEDAQYELVAESVALRWKAVILERRPRFDDLLALLRHEQRWLEERAKDQDDPRLAGMAADLAQTIASISVIPVTGGE